jgi:hypothetical protein
MSDLLYSSPYDALRDADTSGGLAGKEMISGSSCNHLIYDTKTADWQLWISEKGLLPCRLEIKYKRQKQDSFYRITFSKWNLNPQVKKDLFVSKIPEGYVRIPILERVVLQPKP